MLTQVPLPCRWPSELYSPLYTSFSGSGFEGSKVKAGPGAGDEDVEDSKGVAIDDDVEGPKVKEGAVDDDVEGPKAKEGAGGAVDDDVEGPKAKEGAGGADDDSEGPNLKAGAGGFPKGAGGVCAGAVDDDVEGVVAPNAQTAPD